MINLLRRKSSGLGLAASSPAGDKPARAQPPASSILVDIAKAACVEPEKADPTAFVTLADTANRTQDPSELDQLAAYLSETLKTRRAAVNLAGLQALETLFLSCQSPVHKALAVPSIVSPILALIERQKKPTADNSQVSSRALDLIRAWGEGFRTQRDYGDGKVIVDAYKELLKMKWLTWPPKSTPVFNPNPGGAALSGALPRLNEPGAFGSGSPKPLRPRKPASMRPGSLGAFQSADAASFRQDFDNFDLNITALETELNNWGGGDVKSSAIVAELVLVCHRIAPQITTIIEILSSTIADPAVLDPFLIMNDRLLRALQRHKKMLDESTSLNPFGGAPRPAAAASHNPFEDQSKPSTNPFDEDYELL